MNEQELRSLVREAVERHLGRRPAQGATQVAPYSSPEGRSFEDEPSDVRRARRQSRFEGHPSHILLKVVPGSEADDGMCVIEPAVRCNHCGFCQSCGH